VRHLTDSVHGGVDSARNPLTTSPSATPTQTSRRWRSGGGVKTKRGRGGSAKSDTRPKDNAAIRRCASLLLWLKVSTSSSKSRLPLTQVPVMTAKTAAREETLRVPIPLGGSIESDVEFVAFPGLDDRKEHVALGFGDWRSQYSPLVRIHSECLTGDVFESVSRDRTLRLWNVQGEPRILRTPHSHSVKCCASDPSGRWIAIASSSGTLAVFDLFEGRWSTEKLTHAEISSLAFDARTGRFLCASYDGHVHVSSPMGGV
jgi:WD40 repeat protein